MIVRFKDRRGNEGDNGDPRRVGGIYGGYGNRNAKVMSTQPWPPFVHDALVAEFRAQGVDATLLDQAQATPNTAVLTGKIHNFSTESRWSKRAHISAIIQVSARDGRTLVNKEIKATESGGMATYDADALEVLLNRVLADFVHKVATDAEIQAAIAAQR